MKQPRKDEGAVAAFEVPSNVREFVERVEREARETYSDHAESRTQYVRGRLIQELSELQRLIGVTVRNRPRVYISPLWIGD